jgi:hypothetical protein
MLSRYLRRAILSGKAPPSVLPSGGIDPDYAGVRKVELSPVHLRNQGQKLHTQFFFSRKAHASNHSYHTDEAETIARSLVHHGGFGMLRIEMHEYSTSNTMHVTQIRFNRKGYAQVNVSSTHSNRSLIDIQQHDRQKERMLSPDNSAVLHQLGITNSSGKIKQSMRSKHVQVDEFVKLLYDGIKSARSSGALARNKSLSLIDLGCGSAYLTLAAREALASDVREVWGVDVSSERKRANEEACSSIGFYNVHFVASDILNAELNGTRTADVVVALHACDTATDEALLRAVRWQSPLIVAAPCCQHHLNKQLRGSSVNERDGRHGQQLLLRHGLLRESLGDLLTEGIRASILRLLGYKVSIVEWVRTEHSPKNTIIRAERSGAQADFERWRELDDCLREYGWIRPKLAKLLSSELSERMPAELSGSALENALGGDTTPVQGYAKANECEI